MFSRNKCNLLDCVLCHWIEFRIYNTLYKRTKNWHNCIAAVSFLIATGSKTTCAVIESLTQLFQAPPRKSCCFSKPGSGNIPYSYSEFGAAISSVFSGELSLFQAGLRSIPYSGCYSGEMFFKKTANKLDQARVDTSAHCFWLTGQVDFFHVRVFNPTVKQRVNRELHKSYKVNEKEKKKQYNERILLFEHGAFTPLVLSAALVARIKIFMPAFQRWYPKKENKIMPLLPIG